MNYCASEALRRAQLEQKMVSRGLKTSNVLADFLCFRICESMVRNTDPLHD